MTAVFQGLPGFQALALLAIVFDLIFLPLIGTSKHNGTIYYVATNGSDSNSGTALSSPFKTISKAATLVKPGDIVYVRGGTYRERVVMRRAGTADKPILFSSYGSETPLIDGESLTINKWDALLHLNTSAQYVIIRGFSIKNSNDRGVAFYGSYNRLEGSSISYTRGVGFYTTDTIGVSVVGNQIFEAARSNLSHTNSGWGAGLQGERAQNFVVSGNTVHSNHGNGINCFVECRNVQVIGNTVYDNGSSNIYLDNAFDSVIEGNLIYETETTYQPRFNEDGSPNPLGFLLANGINLADEDYSARIPGYVPRLANIRVVNNRIIGARNGISFWYDLEGSGLKNVTISDNIIAQTWDSALRLDSGAHSGSVFRNNTLHARQQKLIIAENMGDTRFENNRFYRSDGSSSQAFRWNEKNYDFNGWLQVSGLPTSNRWVAVDVPPPPQAEAMTTSPSP